MKRLYRSSDMPPFLDQRAATFLREGREQFAKYQLDSDRIVAHEGDSLLFLWAGDLVANTLLVQLQALGYSAFSFGVGISVEGVEPDTLRGRLREIVSSGIADPALLSDSVPNREIDRYDCYLPPDLLSLNHASAELDTVATWQVLTET
jgi:ATP-dependent Lhr-like helicase